MSDKAVGHAADIATWAVADGTDYALRCMLLDGPGPAAD